jgi:hypothetical protein
MKTLLWIAIYCWNELASELCTRLEVSDSVDSCKAIAAQLFDATDKLTSIVLLLNTL